MSFEGLLNATVDIQKKTTAQNATSKQLVETWATVYKNVKGRLDQASGQEYQGTVKDIGKATLVLFIPKKYIIDGVNYRIKYGSIIYNIVICSNAGGHFHHWQIYLEEKK